MNDRREPILNVPPVVVWLLGALVVVHAVRMGVLSIDTDNLLLLTFAFIPARYEATLLPGGLLPGGWGAEIWSFVTYALIHADITHLIVNSIWLLAFGSPVAQRFGSLRFSLFMMVTAAAGALAHLISHSGAMIPVIGASAAVSGAMGAATRFIFQPGGPLDSWRFDAPTRQLPAAPLLAVLRNPRVVTFLVIWFGVNLVFGVGSVSISGEDQIVAWEAHVGGFLAGLLLFPLFDPQHPPVHPPLDGAWGEDQPTRPET